MTSMGNTQKDSYSANATEPTKVDFQKFKDYFKNYRFQIVNVLFIIYLIATWKKVWKLLEIFIEAGVFVCTTKYLVLQGLPSLVVGEMIDFGYFCGKGDNEGENEVKEK